MTNSEARKRAQARNAPDAPRDHAAEALAGVLAEVLHERMSVGTSGRYIVNYGLNDEDLATVGEVPAWKRDGAEA